MQARFTTDRDPVLWCAAIALAFLALVWWRLGIPHEIYFDEIHYVGAARKQLEHIRVNPEHPMFAKSVLALAIEWLGDRSLVWRLPSAIGGVLGLFAFTRLVWFASGSARAAMLAGLLLASDFFWFIHSRIAMLDMTMAALAMLALWQLAAAVRLPHQGRWRLALGGVLMGLALGAKWSVAPALLLPGLVFAAMKLKANGKHFLLARAGGPVDMPA
jgi:dolichyl-phosphate-mannose-protein mannosyltransferase